MWYGGIVLAFGFAIVVWPSRVEQRERAAQGVAVRTSGE
jgi:hypothetical protein